MVKSSDPVSYDVLEFFCMMSPPEMIDVVNDLGLVLPVCSRR